MAYDENIYARIISGELSEDEISKLKNSGEWEEIQAILDETGAWTLPEFNSEQKLKEWKSGRNQKQSKGIKNLSLSKWIGVAASIVVILGFLFFWKGNNVSYEAKYTSTMEVLLPDGSELMLNDGSSVSFSKNEWGADRQLSLEGEAFFKVEKGTKFSVFTDNGMVEVLGTSFNVRAWGTNLHVECYEGSVRVTNSTGESTLEALESVNVVEGVFREKIPINHIKPYWSEGSSRFHEESLETVFAEVERQYNVKIEFEGTSAPFTGSFSHSNLNEAIDQVCIPMNLQSRLIADDHIIISD